MIEPGSLVLVTGVSGFLGAHIIDQLLCRGFRVRGTARSQEKLDHVRSKYPDQHKLELAIVEDVVSKFAFDNILRGASAVIHVASPFTVTPKDNEMDLLRPARDGTLNVLEAAANTSSIRRVIITSTMAAISHIGSGPIPGKIYTESDWNPVRWDDAVNSTDGHYVYCASKTFAEQEAWKFMEMRKPSFDLISINPAWLIGPFLHHVEVPSALGESLRECYCNFARKEDNLPSTIVQYWVDVRDAAKAHVLALEDSEANGRYLVVSRDKFDWKKAFEGIRDRFPDKDFPRGDSDYLVESRPDVDPVKAETQFGLQWIPLAKAFGDMYDQLHRLPTEKFLDGAVT